MADSSGEITLLLAEMKRGNHEALPRLVPLLYDELRRLAGHFLREERPGALRKSEPRSHFRAKAKPPAVR